MYRCHDCGAVFNEPIYEKYIEDHGDGILEPWVVRHCPDCGGEDISDTDVDFIIDTINEMRL